MRRTGVVVAGLLWMAACNDAGAPVRDERSSNPLLAAVEITEAAGSARGRLAFRMTGYSPRSSALETSRGAVDWEREIGEVKTTHRFTSKLRGALEVPPTWSVWDDHFLYLKGDRVTEFIRGSPEWVRLSFLETPSPSAVPGYSADPSRAIEFLRGATSRFEVVGSELVRGARTTRYEAQLDPNRILRLAPDPETVESGLHYFEAYGWVEAVPAHVWLDEEGRLVRFRVERRTRESTETLTIDLFDFGVDVSVEIPEGARAVSPLDLIS
jgi:hypothetical protein